MTHLCIKFNSVKKKGNGSNNSRTASLSLTKLLSPPDYLSVLLFFFFVSFFRSSIHPRTVLKSPCLLSTRKASKWTDHILVSCTATGASTSPSRRATASPASSLSGIWEVFLLSPTSEEEGSTGRPGTKVSTVVQHCRTICFQDVRMSPVIHTCC